MGGATQRAIFFVLVWITFNKGAIHAGENFSREVNYFFDFDSIEHFPDFSREAIFLNLVRVTEPNIGVEIKSSLKTDVDFSQGVNLLNLYNKLHQISHLKGLEYYSVTKGRNRVLFEDAFRIDGGGREVADTTFNQIPGFVSYSVVKTDVIFGTNRYKVDWHYFKPENIIVMVFRNSGALTMFGIPIVDALSFYTISIIIPRENEIRYYILGSVKTVGVFGLERRRADSIYNRINAVLKWASELNH